ncbi:MAG: acyl carrier protein [Thermodesulfobacteriota bacterium]
MTADKETILGNVVRILNDLTGDWEMEFSGPVGPGTMIISDLEFESIDVVQFVVQIEEQYKRKDLPFEKLLMRDGRYRDDISVGEVVDFLHTYL